MPDDLGGEGLHHLDGVGAHARAVVEVLGHPEHHHEDFTPVSGHSLMRTKFDEIGMWMEEKMGHPFFCCDAVLDTYSHHGKAVEGVEGVGEAVLADVLLVGGEILAVAVHVFKLEAVHLCMADDDLSGV